MFGRQMLPSESRFPVALWMVCLTGLLRLVIWGNPQHTVDRAQQAQRPCVCLQQPLRQLGTLGKWFNLLGFPSKSFVSLDH